MVQLGMDIRSSTPLFEIRFSGESVYPGEVRSKDIGEIIMAIEDMIAVMIVDSHAQIDIKKDSILVGVSAIKSGSLTLAFHTNDYGLGKEAFDNISAAVNNSKILSLPSEVRKNLGKILSFNKKHNCDFDAHLINGEKASFFHISQDAEIPQAPTIRGTTTIYGQVTRVGGATEDSPKIQFKHFSEGIIYCSSSKKIAVDLGKRLYERVALRGIAEWNAETRRIVNFEAKSILDYSPKRSMSAFYKLKDRFSDSFEGVSDADEFVKSLRQD